jgi:hypothetical protein
MIKGRKEEKKEGYAQNLLSNPIRIEGSKEAKAMQSHRIEGSKEAKAM